MVIAPMATNPATLVLEGGGELKYVSDVANVFSFRFLLPIKYGIKESLSLFSFHEL